MSERIRAAVLVLFLSLLAGLSSTGHAQTPAAKSQAIRLHPANPHYFLLHGKAVVLITSGEHYGAVLNADFDYKKYLAQLAADGLNYTRLFAGSYVEVPGKSFGILHNDLAPEPGKLVAPWTRSDAPGYAGGGNKFDLERWNDQFFVRLRDFLNEAERRGIVVELALFSSHYGEEQWRMSPFHPDNNTNGIELGDWKKLNTVENGKILGYQEKYARKIVREANGFDNVIFEIANEPWSDRPVLTDLINPYLRPPGRDSFPNSVDLPDELAMAWQERVADWIRQEELSLAKRHLVAQNYSNFGLPVKKLIAGVDVVNFHYAYPEAALLNYGLGKAIACDETGFLGRDDEAYRRQAWKFLLNGGGAFDALDYSFTVGHEDGSYAEANGPGGGSAALRRQLRVLREFMQSFDLVELRPDMAVVKRAGGATAAVLAKPGREYAIYLDGAGPVEVALTLPAGEYGAEWISVETGKTEQREMFRHERGERALTSPEFRNGIALRIKRVAAGPQSKERQPH